ncbi:methyl-accepting chemotaxis protein [Vibrio tapetis subsp. quintayensis]|uniref:methyl-accepting chemotaxis protein n=1 Tax=Vibrio tapetis TaxID=52443 RepID=UPI0025B33745|nr:methyl-accepting chemotaxis protein [Vibrio tapetis]MDN3679738.1 methyl-accepting chemotaxis protein [Vibrio tapetis subsp. quintayensis]
MNWFSSRSLRSKMISPVASMVILFSAITLYNSQLFSQQTQATEKLNQSIQPVMDSLEDGYRDLYQVIAAAQGLMLANGEEVEIEHHTAEFKDNAYRAVPRLESIGRLIDLGILSNSSKPMLKDLLAATEQWVKSYELMFQSPLQANSIYATNKNQLNQEFKTIRKNLKSLSNEIENQQITLREQISESVSRSKMALEVGSIIAILIGIALTWLLSGWIVAPIHRLNKTMSEIASGDGDLTQRVSVESGDEVGELGRNFNAFADTVQVTVADVVDCSIQIRNEMEQFAILSEKVATGVSSQQQESEMVATAINEMRVTSTNVSDNALQAAEASENGSVEVVAAGSILNQTVQSIHGLADEISTANQVINKLDDDVANIASILDVIRGIAEQTNLLALNAAIEAARAGEQGRGFAVVADEVRALASKTQVSTGEIQTMIEKLQSGAKQAVSVMESSKKGGESTVEQAQSAVTSLAEINRSIQVINEMNAHIATAASQQTSVSEEVNQNIQRIAENSQSMVEVVERADEASGNLAQQCERLDTLVSRFKI